jgi:hypothetical protein
MTTSSTVQFRVEFLYKGRVQGATVVTIYRFGFPNLAQYVTYVDSYAVAK